MVFRGEEIRQAGRITTEFPSQISCQTAAKTYGIWVGREMGRGEASLALFPEGCVWARDGRAGTRSPGDGLDQSVFTRSLQRAEWRLLGCPQGERQ